MPTRSKPTPPTTILFVRHGQTPTTGKILPGRAPGLHLADEGQAQARAAARLIAAAHPKTAAIYCSPLERTRETAAPIAKALGLRVRIDKGLLECDFGQWTGARLVALAKKPEWMTVQRNPSGFRFPAGESFIEMQNRMVDAAQRLTAKHPGQTIVCVSHADPIKAAANHAVGAHLDQFQRIVISPCSITTIAYGPAGPMVLAVNTPSTDLGELKPS